MEPHKAARLRFLIAVAIAILFLCLTILFIILFATKKCKNSCETVSKPSNAYLVFAQCDSVLSEGEAGEKMTRLFELRLIEASLFTSTTPLGDNKQQIRTIAVTTDSKYSSVTSEQLMAILLGNATQKTANSANVFYSRLALIEDVDGLSIDGVYGLDNSSGNNIAKVCQLNTPTSTTPTTSQSPNPDFPVACKPELIVRDLILVIDLLPNERYPNKFENLEQFLNKFGSDLDLSPTISQISMIGYDGEGVVAAYPFASDFATFERNYKMLLSNASSASKGSSNGLYGKLSAALAYIANDTSGLRAYTEAFVLIIGDHVPADEDTSLTTAKIHIQHLRRSGFYLSAITPTVGPAALEIAKLIPNEQWRSPSTVKSYADLPVGGIRFAIQQACSYIDIVNVTVPTPTASILSSSTSTTTLPPTSEEIVTSATSVATSTTTQIPESTTPGPKQMDCMDIMIILDRSQSIDEDEYNMKIKPFVIDIGKNAIFQTQSATRYSRVGVIQYSDIPELSIAPWDSNSEASFEKLVQDRVNYTHSEGSGGMTNTATALQKALDVFDNTEHVDPQRKLFGTSVILVTDGVDVLSDNPVTVADTLRNQYGTVIVCVGLNGTNGDFSTADSDELLRINGNRTDLLFTVDAEGLSANLSQAIIDNIECPTSMRTTQPLPTAASTTPPPSKRCHLLIFTVETTELVGVRKIQNTLIALKQVAQSYSNLVNDTIFRLITYSSATRSKVHGDLQDDLSQFTGVIDGLLAGNNLSPYVDGQTFLANGVKLTTQLIQEYYNRGDFYQGNPIVTIIGQDEKKKIVDSEKVKDAAEELHSRARYVFVGDQTTVNPDPNNLWDLIASEPSNTIPLKDQKDSQSIANVITAATKNAWTDMVCGTPPIKECSPERGALDVFLILHQTANNETQTKLGKLAAAISSGFEMLYDQMHLAVMQYNGVNASYVEELKAHEITALQRRIRSVRYWNETGENISKPFELIRNEYSNGNTSPAGKRRFASTVVIYITDSAGEITNNEALTTMKMVNEWRERNCESAPAMVLVEVGNATLQEQVIELFGNTTQGRFKSWDDVHLQTQSSVVAVNSAIDYMCSTDRQRACQRCCDCETGLDTTAVCKQSASAAKAVFMSLLHTGRHTRR